MGLAPCAMATWAIPHARRMGHGPMPLGPCRIGNTPWSEACISWSMGMPHAACSTWHFPCPHRASPVPHHATCPTHRAAGPMGHAPCGMPHVACPMPHRASRNMPHAPCSMPHGTCPMRYGAPSMPNVSSPMWHAPRSIAPMPNSPCGLEAQVNP